MRRLREFFSGRKGCRPLEAEGGRLALKYRAFRNLLGHNNAALAEMAEMEHLYFGGRPFSLSSVRIRYEALLEAVYGIIHSLEALSGSSYPVLSATADRIDGVLFENFNPKCLITTGRLVIPFGEIGPEMAPNVGAKAANLAAIGNSLGLPVPKGFAVTAFGFERYLEENRLAKAIEEELSHTSLELPEENGRRAERIRALIMAGRMPSDLEEEILRAYEAAGAGERGVRVAMRSSAVGEDTEATFAGQYETVLNVTRDGLIPAYKKVLAGKYSGRAISYRLLHGFEDRETPMCVAVVAMVDARASGVMYTLDPSSGGAPVVKINSLWGLGEQLVDGSCSADVFLADRSSGEVIGRTIASKEKGLESLAGGGTALRDLPPEERSRPSLGDEDISILAGYGLLLEEFFGSPQDVEWAKGPGGEIFILQSRRLFLPDTATEKKKRRDFPGHPVLLRRGSSASPGIAFGRVFIPRSLEDLNSVSPESILVARTASPEYARVAGIVKGLITDIGSVTSHMASVAREFGIPAILDAGDATAVLQSGDLITMDADGATVYSGLVEELAAEVRPSRRPILESPLHLRMKGILDLITPLNLSDTNSPMFSPEGCRTFHDIIRFTHEEAVRGMFGMSEDTAGAGRSLRLVSRLPLGLLLIDLGGGLREGLTTCDDITPGAITSVPLAAIWRGFTHPGVSWKGTMNPGTETISGRFAAAATSEFGEPPGGDSYALISGDYLNLSARFAYHFATVDALCSENSGQNYISLQFSGGAADYYGRALRVQLMANILRRLDFAVTARGDLLEAGYSRGSSGETAERLDLLGRLLASGRLLDMTLTGQEDLPRLEAEFFRGNYDFLADPRENNLPALYARGGRWSRVVEDGRAWCVQDGSPLGRRLSIRVAGAVGRVIGSPYYEFLDTIEAYYTFPLAVVKDSRLSGGRIGVNLRAVSGILSRSGGIAFGIRDRDNYFALGINALKGNVMLYEFVNGRRYRRVLAESHAASGVTYRLQVDINEGRITGLLDGEHVISLDAGRQVDGFVGLWTASDSTVWFEGLDVEETGEKKRIGF